MLIFMRLNQRKILFLTICLICPVIIGCVQKAKVPESATITQAGTIGSIGEVFLPGAIRVGGYGIVGSLNGTGSAECPPNIRSYLRQYILKQSMNLDADEVINSMNTAVVQIEGIMPAGSYEGQRFDLSVSAIEGSQTTSLQGGWLYSADLKPADRVSSSVKILAGGKGPVFINPLGEGSEEQRNGYVLGGGIVLDEYNIRILLRQPDYRTSSILRNRINERFGGEAARALSPSVIEIKSPKKYRKRKRRFQSLLRVTPLSEGPQTGKDRIIKLVAKMVSSENKGEAEITLEAIGRKCLPQIWPLLNSSDDEVRLRSARCMLNLGNDRGLEVLREIALAKESLYRLEALEAIKDGGGRENAGAISRLLVRDEDFQVKLAAYKTLIELNDIAVTSEPLGRKFYLDQIAQANYKGIYVTRSGKPRIVIFGAPIYCRRGVFVQSSNGDIVINSPQGQEELMILRKHSNLRNAPAIKRSSSLEISDIIRNLAEESKGSERQGLDVSYAEIISLLQQMCQQGTIQAEFRAGPLPETVP